MSYTMPITSLTKNPANPRSIKAWRVFVCRSSARELLGEVNESNEELARCAALSKYGISEDEAEEGTLRPGIYPADDFEVTPA